MISDLDIPVTQFTSWIPGLIGFLFVVLLVIMIWNGAKKAFGRKPPFDEQLSQIVKLLRGEIHREKNSVLKEIKLTLKPIVEKLEKAEIDISDIQLDRQRKWEKLSNQIGEIANDVSFMRGVKKGESSK